MKTLFVAALVLAAALATPAGAAMAQVPQPNFPNNQALVRAVALCADEVRVRRPGVTNFEAYVIPATESVSYWGSKQEHWLFEKCLVMKGHPMDLVEMEGTPK